jgi:Protein of unknown function (DUF1492)
MEDIVCDEKRIGDYFELVAKKNELEKECFEKIDKIVELKSQIKENEELKNAIKIDEVYEDFVKEWNCKSLKLLLKI